MILPAGPHIRLSALYPLTANPLRFDALILHHLLPPSFFLVTLRSFVVKQERPDV